MKRLSLIILILMWSSVSYGATYYVNATGGDNSRTTTQAQNSATPWLTIQKCADNTVAGDTCVVAAGTYNEIVTESTNGTSGNYITYVANPHLNAVVRGFNLTSRSYIRVIGFEVTHLSTEAHAINITAGTNNQILYNYVHNVKTGYGIDINSETSSLNIVRGNRVEFLKCPASGPCLGGGPIQLEGTKNLIEYNSLAHVNDFFPMSNAATAYNILRNNYMGHCYHADNPDNTHEEGRLECTGNGTASDSTGDYYASCCTGLDTGATCTARHIDGVQHGSKSNYFLFEKNYYDIGDDTTLSAGNRHAYLIRASGTLGIKIRDNIWKNLVGSYFSNGTGFRYYNNTAINSPTNGVSWTAYGETAYPTNNTDGKAFNNIYSNASSATGRVWSVYTRTPANELIADYELWYNFSAYYNVAYQAPSTWAGGASQTLHTDPLLETNFTLTSESPAKGAGVTITLANGAAAEATTTLVVDDAQPFVGQDWAVKDASGSAYGDTIIIGTNDPVTVTAVNYDTDTITISAAQTWADDAPVRLSHHNADMDIGAYPYKAGGYALTGTWALSEGTVTVTPSDASLVRFVEVLENGIPVGVDYTSPYTVAGVGAGTVTVKMFSLYASSTPIVEATLSGDETAPTLAAVTPVSTPSADTTPEYVFSSDQAGTITYGGTCGTGSLTNAIAGNNTVTWTLSPGTYSNCTITVNDGANSSTPLAVAEFVISGTPTYTLTVTKTGAGCSVVTSPSTDINCGSTCSATVGEGTAIQLFGTSNNGWNAITYGGDCAANGTVTMSTGGKTCTATCTQVQLFP
jgi:hypothetical protein